MPQRFPPALETRTRLSADRATVVARGELDVLSAPRLARAIRRAESKAPALMVIDLRGVTFFDVAGVHVLAQARTRAHAKGYSLRISCEGAPVRRVLGLCGFSETHFDFEPSPLQPDAA